MRQSGIDVRVILGLSLSALLAACGGGRALPVDPAEPGRSARPGGAEAAAGSPPFVEVAAETGLDFVHWNGMVGELDYPEMMGSGVALFDFDGDGDLDVYLVQGNPLRPDRLADAVFPPPAPPPLTDRLFRNDLEIGPDGTRTLRFTDVTAEAGIAATGYGMGAAAGDFDNDGDVDLYVTNLGPNQLWRNDGPGAGGTTTFTDVTAESGAGEPRWSVPAVPVDVDGDGWLDLFVGNYVAWDPESNPRCVDVLGMDNYCGPLAFPPLPDALLRNRGDGRLRFDDVAAAAGLGAAFGGALGAVAADFDDDGRLDLYVANDGMPNQLWRNDGPGPDGTVAFTERALAGGAAVSGAGQAQAGMGVAAADVDDDGDEDLFVAHLTGETNTLYVNLGGGGFEDRSVVSGLGPPSWAATGFGTALLDYDNDGRLDVFVANGAVKVIKDQHLAGDPLPLRQPSQLFHNVGSGGAGETGGLRFEEVTGAAAEAFARPGVGRGAAFGDLDNDGDLDVVVSQNSGPVRLLRNQVGQDRAWLGLRLVETVPGGVRDAWGARARVRLAGGRERTARVGGTGSYASSSDPRLLFGLGDGAAVEWVRVRWAEGDEEEWWGLQPGRYTLLIRGTGSAVGSAPGGSRGAGER